MGTNLSLSMYICFVRQDTKIFFKYDFMCSRNTILTLVNSIFSEKFYAFSDLCVGATLSAEHFTDCLYILWRSALILMHSWESLLYTKKVYLQSIIIWLLFTFIFILRPDRLYNSAHSQLILIRYPYMIQKS